MTSTKPLSPDTVAELQQCLDLLVDDGALPGGVLAHGARNGRPAFVSSGVVAPECGNAGPGPDTLYDAASLTKVLATWPLIGLTDGITADTTVRDLLPDLPDQVPGANVTVGQILAHTSGLRPETRLDQYRGRTEPLAELICGEPLIAEPGVGHRYINRGFILLGLALAHLHGRRLDELAADLWQSLGMPHTAYGPVSRSADVAPTEQRLPGGPRLWGIPHDDNATLLGGVAGHAGVFTTPADLATFADRLLTAYTSSHGLGAWLRTSMEPKAEIEPGLHRGLAWILADGGRVAYHHGFTGTSLYLAPDTGRYLAICTNAVYHHQNNRTRLAPLRNLALKAVAAD
ncbi:serine hydrolase domain-containing protein [Kitasatospora sp. NPDC058397]|uniref:serine hydrolase domain-containing protein n=1 Tax=unclassified Kitasatospora TaxID=2633591 RepID=UPI0036631E06